jgi:hypothetical protein
MDLQPLAQVAENPKRAIGRHVGQMRTRCVEWFRVGLGAFLLVAAVLKTHGLSLGPVAEDSFLSSPRLQIAAIEIEILLGLFLLSKLARQLTWLAAIGFFTIAAGLSLYQALDRQPSCGCFGAVSVDPRATLVLDILILTGLVICRPLPFPAALTG